MDDVILVEDENDQPQLNPGPSYTNRPKRNTGDGIRGKGRGRKRHHNGTAVTHVDQTGLIYLPGQLPINSSAYGTTNTTLSPMDRDPVDSVVVDGQDIYFIEEIEEGNLPTFPADNIPVLPTYYLPGDGSETLYSAPDLVEAELEQRSAKHVSSEEVEVDDYYEVTPSELSDIWNDLITANQEILILLELQDLKHHIVDARRIEDQLQNMACEYCPRILPDIRTWNQHIIKIHFQTSLLECDSCACKFKYYSRFKDHLQGHMNQRVYQCDECDHQYAFRMGFLVHKILDHMKFNGIYVCPKCDLDCKDAQNYKLHIAKHIDFSPSFLSATDIAPQASVATSSTSAATVAPAKTKLDVIPANSQLPRNTASPVPLSKENDRNKFLNVFETFFKEQRKVGGTLEGLYKKKKLP